MSENAQNDTVSTSTSTSNEKTTEKAKEKAKESREKDNEIRRQNEEIIDKQILTLSSALLAISMAFSDKIVPLREAILIFLLIVSWLFWFVSIFLILWTHYLVIRIARKRVLLNYQIWVEGKKELKDKYMKKSKGPRNFQVWAGILFLSGCICLLLYLGVNTYKINKTSTSTNKTNIISNKNNNITTLRKDLFMAAKEYDESRQQQELEHEIRTDSITESHQFSEHQSGSTRANEAIDLDDPEDHDNN